ncbi:MAG: type III pantothenate kinase [Planctomycetes bacterium]|nr:type III pantothenate kinase [Planctomycetota bacterium]
MIKIPSLDPNAPIVVVGIGNTRTGVATWHNDELKTPQSVGTADQGAFEELFAAHCAALDGSNPPPTVIGSVVPEALERVCAHVLAKLDRNALVVGETVPLPIEVEVEDPKAIGVDRACAAAAAYDRLQTACVVVDFGTAVTVDLVNDEGVLLGGAILPGLGLQLQALGEHTAQLPTVRPAVPELPYGRNTTEAMQIGVCRGVAGAVRGLIEGYATALHRWPQVVATGGDLELLGPHIDYVDTLVADLTLRGIALAYTKYLAEMGI